MYKPKDLISLAIYKKEFEFWTMISKEYYRAYKKDKSNNSTKASLRYSLQQRSYYKKYLNSYKTKSLHTEQNPDFSVCTIKEVKFCKYCGSKLIKPMHDNIYKCYECGALF